MMPILSNSSYSGMSSYKAQRHNPGNFVPENLNQILCFGGFSYV